MDADEPDDLESIRALRPDGPRRLCMGLPADDGRRLRGAFCGRMAGCTLGAALEFHSLEDMEEWARRTPDVYPLEDYWDQLHCPDAPHYITGKKRDLTRGHMAAVPPDDNTIYTLLGLLTMEQHGVGFTQEDMAQIWQRYLPVDPEAGIHRNPNMQNIAAWTREDSYGYACPGWPEKAAELAWRDASANHRRNGVYGSMFMAATIAAAFAVDVTLLPSAIRGKQGVQVLKHLLQAYCALGGAAIQFNFADTEMLKKALAEPLKYKNLMVRVWGYNDYFVALRDDLQKHIIDPTRWEERA